MTERRGKPRPKPSDYRIRWAELLKRTFRIDRSVCPACGGRMRMISAIMSRETIDKILGSMNILALPPP